MPQILSREKIAELARRGGKVRMEPAPAPVSGADKAMTRALEQVTEAMKLAAEQNSLAVLGALDGIKSLLEAMAMPREAPACAWDFEFERDRNGRLQRITATPVVGH